jgi:hypothetical protein
MSTFKSVLWVGGAVGFSIAGLAFFILLFGGRLNSFWVILAPVIFAVYQIPAVVIFALWKRRLRKNAAVPEDSPESAADEGEEETLPNS